MTKQPDKQELEPRTVELVRSTYQPSKAERRTPDMTTPKRKRQKRSRQNITRRVVQVKPHTYQPSVAELREPVRLAVTPEKLRAATMRDVKLREID